METKKELGAAVGARGRVLGEEKAVGGQWGQRLGDVKAGKRGGGAGGCRILVAGTASHLKDPLKPTSYAFTVLCQLVPGLERLALAVHKIAPTVLKL